MSRHQEDDSGSTISVTADRAARLDQIDDGLRICVVYHDEDIVVIDKPGNLRSVAGHADHPPPLSSSTAERESSRMTAQQAWQEAIRSCSSLSAESLLIHTEDISGKGDKMYADSTCRKALVAFCLKKLSASESTIASIPRKWKLFQNYVLRNQKRILPTSSDRTIAHSESITVGEIASCMYAELQTRQAPLLNLPEPTRDEDSAYGQLVLMGYGADNSKEIAQIRQKDTLFVVHRLDCETSGIMVFARKQSAASTLSRAWRERDQVSKEYWATVRHWPPYHEEGLLEGTIDVPLTPSEERLKWKVAEDDDASGKPSKTVWKIINEEGEQKGRQCAGSSSETGTSTRGSGTVLLSLSPITGRTHQLRVHCAFVGSGILGDSLYGEDCVKATFGQDGKGLRLHAHKLCFRHPATGRICEFSSFPPWS